MLKPTKLINFMLLLSFLSILIIGSVMGGNTTDVEISDCLDLQNISNYPTLNYTLIDDINCSDTVNWNNGSGFVPIYNFTGIFEGNGYTISDLYIFMNETDDVGLFSRVESDTGLNFIIQNVTFQSPSITGQNNVGVIAGVGSPEIYNVNILDAMIDGTANIGGMIGNADSDYPSPAPDNAGAKLVIDKCYFQGVITSTGTNVGGFIGIIWLGHSQNEIRNSYANSDIISGSNTGGFSNTGGLVGQIRALGGANEQHKLTIVNCSSDGTILSSGDKLGGIIGSMYVNIFKGAEVIDSYSRMEISGGEKIGGIVGNYRKVPGVPAYGGVTNTYSTGLLSGTLYIGGIVGYPERDGTYQDSYWDISTTNTSLCIGVGSCINSYGNITKLLYNSSFYSTFDFTGVWDNNDYYFYPTLKSLDYDYIESNICTPEYECLSYNDCLNDNTQNCDYVIETNHCSIPYSGNFSEFELSCDYCDDDVQIESQTSCTGSLWDICYVDVNFATCCNVTGIATDCYDDTVQNESIYCFEDVECSLFDYTGDDIPRAMISTIVKGLVVLSVFIGIIMILVGINYLWFRFGFEK